VIPGKKEAKRGEKRGSAWRLPLGKKAHSGKGEGEARLPGTYNPKKRGKGRSLRESWFCHSSIPGKIIILKNVRKTLCSTKLDLPDKKQAVRSLLKEPPSIMGNAPFEGVFAVRKVGHPGDDVPKALFQIQVLYHTRTSLERRS